MVLKKITIHVKLSEEVIQTLQNTYPAIIQKVYIGGAIWSRGTTVFEVDVTSQQETQIRSVLMDAIIQIEPL